MSNRFISINYSQNKIDEAKKYYSSVFFTNIFLVLILLVPTALLILHLNRIFNIPANLKWDVQMTFAFAFLGFYFNLLASVFSMAFFVKNRIDLASGRDITGNLIKICIIILLFVFFPPEIFYVTLAFFVSSLAITGVNIYYTQKLTPELTVSYRLFDFQKVRELASSSIWNSFGKISEVMETGLDLFITNLYLGASMMGTLAIAKVVPVFMMTLTSTIVAAFAPQFIITYAVKKSTALENEISQAIKIMTIYTSVVCGLFMAFSFDFFSLWVPGEDAGFLRILAILSILHMPVTGSIHAMYYIYTVTNKIRFPSIVDFTHTSLSVIFVLVIIHTTNLGIYAVAGLSSVLALISTLVFSIPYAARCLGIKWKTYYPAALWGIIATLTVVAVSLGIRHFMVPHSWLSLALAVILSGTVCLIANLFILLNRQERNMIKTRIGKYLTKLTNT